MENLTNLQEKDFEIISIDEIPEEIRDVLGDIAEVKYGYLFFGKKAIKFIEPPIEISTQIMKVYSQLLEKMYQNIIEEYKKATGIKKLTEEDLKKIGLNIGMLNEVELKRNIDLYKEYIIQIISLIVGEKLAKELIPKMTSNQLIYNLLSIISLILYGKPLHEILKEQKERQKLLSELKEQLKEKENKQNEQEENEEKENPF